MPTKRKRFERVRFPASLLEEVAQKVDGLTVKEYDDWRAANPGLSDGDVMPDGYQAEPSSGTYLNGLEVEDSDGWTKYDRPEAFFLRLNDPCDAYHLRTGTAGFRPGGGTGMFDVEVSFRDGSTTVEICHPDEVVVDRFMALFKAAESANRLPDPEPDKARIFVAHGHSNAWLELSNFLHSQMGYEVEAYETLPRAGHNIKEVLEAAIKNNNFALLVLTAEDEQADHTVHPRLNVVHEAGLFQGAFGFHRAIVILEEGAEEFSNIAGINQLRFMSGNIKAVHGDVLATLKREFG